MPRVVGDDSPRLLNEKPMGIGSRIPERGHIVLMEESQSNPALFLHCFRIVLNGD
jgi:hypothetical protein